MADAAWQGLARHGLARPGEAWQGKADMARPGMARHGMARHGRIFIERRLKKVCVFCDYRREQELFERIN
jgi:hypothetical protein